MLDPLLGAQKAKATERCFLGIFGLRGGCPFCLLSSSPDEDSCCFGLLGAQFKVKLSQVTINVF